MAAITGTGTITVGSGATLTFTGPINNAGLNITLNGGTLNLNSFTHNVGGTLAVSGASTVDFSSSGDASLTVGAISIPATGTTLAATNWTAGSDHFYATSFANGPGTRRALGVTPINQIALGSNASSLTYWNAGTPGELLAATALTFWDTTGGNGTVDGGTGTWDGATANWTSSTGAPNGNWAGGTNTATFQGTAGTVTVSGTQSIGGLNFVTSGYSLTGGGLGLAQASTVTLGANTTTSIATPFSGSFGLTLDGASTSTSTLNLTSGSTYTGGTVVTDATIQPSINNGGCTLSAFGSGVLSVQSGGLVVTGNNNQLGCSFNGTGTFVSGVTLQSGGVLRG
ncbi:hypothetical protein WDZ92_41460, partial [Nostoc sp. NIES-2111]